EQGRDLRFAVGGAWKAAAPAGKGVSRVGRPAISTTCAHDRRSIRVCTPELAQCAGSGTDRHNNGCQVLLSALGRRGGNAPRRRAAVILSPAVTTAGACSLPGERVRRSMGPETETAAMMLPPSPRTGADTDAPPAPR